MARQLIMNGKWISFVLMMVLGMAHYSFASGKAPDGLMVEFLGGESVTGIHDPEPEFGWVVHSSQRNDVLTAYRILVSTDPERLKKDEADLWDSGKVESGDSINVVYKGKPLLPGRACFWKVKTWLKLDGETAWSEPMQFSAGAMNDTYSTTRYPLQHTTISPASITEKAEGHYLVDFGRVAFGHLRLELDPKRPGEMEVHFGERGDANGVNRTPGGTVRYYRVLTPYQKGRQVLEVRPPKNGRNTRGKAILLPDEIGVIAPFRYVELVNFPVRPVASMIHQVAVHYPFDASAAGFQSSDPLLNDIWELCRYSMKATSFCGVYVDGERERIPYEADAYINQLSHYAVDREYSLARYSHEYLLTHPTWPTEWLQHSVLMAHADYFYTGNAESIAHCYDLLKAEKTLEQHAREDGLLNTKGLRDIVDWPAGERDGYVFKEINTVVNAFYYKTLLQMKDLAGALGRTNDVVAYAKKAARVEKVFNAVLFDAGQGRYVDGEGTDHSSLHANMMPLAFGLVPEEHKKAVTDFVVSRGMACSVYGAQYLLEALYEGGRADAALALMTSRDIRSWYNMLRVGSTITLEAWDNTFKPNQDWNHAWGAVPGNIIPRYLLGVRPLEPGFKKVLIQPQPASLESATAVIPTIRGPIQVGFVNEPERFTLNVDVPVTMTAKVGLPQRGTTSAIVLVNGKKVVARPEAGFLFVDAIGSGNHVLVSESISGD